MGQNEIGYTDLIGRHGVSKADRRFDAIGTIDEASSAISLAKAFCDLPIRKAILEKAQNELMMIMADLAGMTQFSMVTSEQFSQRKKALQDLESLITELKQQIINPKRFILGGANPYSGALNLARSVVRRAEREVLRLYESEGPTDHTIAQYLNRLSMMLFLLELEAEVKVG
jgi:cob(I)alamin adenosyltransferase